MCERSIKSQLLALSEMSCGVILVGLCLSKDNIIRTRYCIVGSVIGSAVPIAMVVMGAIHIDNCPAERYIPIYLIVAGCFTIALILIKVKMNLAEEKEDAGSCALHFLSVVLILFMLCWLIAGSVWIYRIYNKYDPDNVLVPNYCNNTFYLFAFWLTNMAYILIAILILIGCIAIIAIYVVLPILIKICGPCVRDTCVTCCSFCECGRELCERMSSTQSDDQNSVPQSRSDPYTRY